MVAERQLRCGLGTRTLSCVNGCIGERSELVSELVFLVAGPSRGAANSIHSTTLNVDVAFIPLVAACLVKGSTGNMEEILLW